MNPTDLTRRSFLRALAAGGMACAFARTPGTAFAQVAGEDDFSDYKALVCVFLFGGNDSWNMLVPSSEAEYAVYADSRQNLAVPQASLLPLDLATPDASGWTFGLHPAHAGARGALQFAPRRRRRERRTAARSRPRWSSIRAARLRCRRSSSRTTISAASGTR